MAAGDAGDAVALGEAVIAAGVGCRSDVGAGAVLAAVDAALDAHGLARADLAGLGTVEGRGAEVSEAARVLGLRVREFTASELAGFEARTLTRSERSLAAKGVGSVSEAAALAAAGVGARLLGRRLVLGAVTCALASTEARR